MSDGAYTLRLRAQLLKELADKLQLEAFTLEAAARREERLARARLDQAHDLRDAQRYCGEQTQEAVGG
jgi:hypothetical protein